MVRSERLTGQDSAEEAPSGASLVLTAVAIGTALAPLNSTMIAVALPDIQASLDVSLTATTWLVAVYLLTMAIGQPICGRLGDLYGRRRMYLSGLALFAMASSACAFAPSLSWLLAFRALQALAGAMCIPNGIALVREAVPVERRGQSMGIIGMAAGTAAAIGPPLGGLLVHLGGWPAIFLANVPVIAVAAVLARRALPRSLTFGLPSGRFDYPGSFLLGLALGTIVLMPAVTESAGGEGLVLLLPLMLAAGGLFIWRERRASAPVVDLALFRHRHYRWACFSVSMSNFLLYTALLATPQLFERVWGYSVQTTGLALASFSAFAVLLGPVSGRWADRSGYWLPAVTGATCLAAGSVLLALSSAIAGIVAIVVSLAIMGVGLGIAAASVQTAAVESVPHEQTGSASGVFSTFRYLGSVVGSSILAMSLSGDPGPGDTLPFTLLFAGMAAVALLGILTNARVAERSSSA
jgi:EmrB/QacA subfamily drug resistance transporter